MAPVLKQYGTYFKTHRVFRQYLYTLVLPVPLLVFINFRKFLNHTETLWTVHANRLNEQYE